jgi:hypothetical protein
MAFEDLREGIDQEFAEAGSLGVRFYVTGGNELSVDVHVTSRPRMPWEAKGFEAWVKEEAVRARRDIDRAIGERALGERSAPTKERTRRAPKPKAPRKPKVVLSPEERQERKRASWRRIEARRRAEKLYLKSQRRAYVIEPIPERACPCLYCGTSLTWREGCPVPFLHNGVSLVNGVCCSAMRTYLRAARAA